MTATVKGTMRQEPTAAINSPSVSKDFTETVILTGIADMSNFRIVTGLSATTPTVYSDLTSVNGSPLPGEFDALTVRGQQATLTLKWDGGFGAGAPGDKLWICLFDGSSDVPGGSTPPTDVAGPFVLVA